MVAPSTAVAAPTIATVAIAVSDSENSGARRATRYTPAVTIVAAWMSADTGVGPSIASGSQTWSGIWALLPQAPRKKSRQTMVTGPKVHIASGASALALLAMSTRSRLPK